MWPALSAELGHDTSGTGTWASVIRHDDGTTSAYTYVFDEGSISAVRAGDEGADVRFELPYDAWLDRLRGERGSMGRAVLNGAVRMTGDPDIAAVLMKIHGSERFRAVQRRVYEQTDWE